MKLYAYMTGERVSPESAEQGDAAERGYVDLSWSRREFFPSRNDVRPLMDETDRSDDLADAVREALAELGAYEDNGDGTFYSADAEADYDETGDFYTYAVHFIAKDHDSIRGWFERAWHPSEAGIETGQEG